MLKGSKGSAGLAALMVLLAIGLALANLAVLIQPDLAAANGDMVAALKARYQAAAPIVSFFAVSPLLFGLLAAVVAARRQAAAPAAAPTAKAKAEPDAAPEASALRLLGLLQQEARFIDFVQEDIDGYDDSQVGAAARTIHSGCRKALEGRIDLERIYADEEGSPIEVTEGFDPAEVRLTGNVAGNPPFRGTLQHSGWRAAKVKLPEAHGNIDPGIIAPAEIDIA